MKKKHTQAIALVIVITLIITPIISMFTSFL